LSAAGAIAVPGERVRRSAAQGARFAPTRIASIHGTAEKVSGHGIVRAEQGLVIAAYDGSIDDHSANPGRSRDQPVGACRQVVDPFERPRPDGRRIEDHDVAGTAGGQPSPSGETEDRGRTRAQTVDRLFDREGAPVPHSPPEEVGRLVESIRVPKGSGPAHEVSA